MRNKLDFPTGNVIKYVMRWRDKNGVQDLQKAKRYIDMMIELETTGQIDKVKKWQLHYFITFPMLKGSFITIALIKAIDSLRSFDLIFTMTKGGPGITTETLDLYAYQQGIGLRGEISYASAMSVAMVIITIVIFTFIWKRAQKS